MRAKCKREKCDGPDCAIGRGYCSSYCEALDEHTEIMKILFTYLNAAFDELARFDKSRDQKSNVESAKNLLTSAIKIIVEEIQ